MSQELDEIRQILIEQEVIINKLNDRVDSQTKRIWKLEYKIGELKKKLEIKLDDPTIVGHKLSYR